MPLTLLQFTPYDAPQEDFVTCHVCNKKVTEDNICLAKYTKEYGWIVHAPEQLCQECVAERIAEFDKHFKPAS